MQSRKTALLISCFDWYEDRLKPIRDILIDKGYCVTVVTSDFLHINKQYIGKKNNECIYVHVPSYKNNISIQRIISHLLFGFKTNLIIKKSKPNLIYLLLPPNNTAIYCARYVSQNTRCKYIVDLVDLWPESMPIGWISHTLPAKVWASFRDNSIRKADQVLLECSYYKEKLVTYFPEIVDKISILRLFKYQSVEERKKVLNTIKQYEEERLNRPHKIILGYLGSINNIIDIDKICEIVKKINNNGLCVEVRIIGDGQSREEFVERLKDSGAETHFYGKIFNQAEKIKILGMCDYGLNIMLDSVSVGLTIKSIDYFSMGLPILNNIKGDTYEMVNEFRIGLNVNDNNFYEKLKTTLINRFHIHNIFETYFSKKSFNKTLEKIINRICPANEGNEE